MLDDDIRLPSAEYLLTQDIGKKQDDTTTLIYRITPEYIDSWDGGRRIMTFMDVVFMDKRRLTYDRLAAMYHNQEEQSRENGVLPYDNTGTYADAYYNRKYTSAFMKEMNRSTALFLKPWIEG